MPMLLNKIEHPPGQERTVRLDIGRTLAIAVIGVTAIVVAAVLWSNDKDAAAFAVFQLGEAVIIGGLGVAIGERHGASGRLDR